MAGSGISLPLLFAVRYGAASRPRSPVSAVCTAPPPASIAAATVGAPVGHRRGLRGRPRPDTSCGRGSPRVGNAGTSEGAVTSTPRRRLRAGSLAVAAASNIRHLTDVLPCNLHETCPASTGTTRPAVLGRISGRRPTCRHQPDGGDARERRDRWTLPGCGKVPPTSQCTLTSYPRPSLPACSSSIRRRGTWSPPRWPPRAATSPARGGRSCKPSGVGAAGAGWR
jgi:hypothetical protein